jgi:outer membrane protein TolC
MKAVSPVCLAGAGLLALSACAVGPDFKRPAAPQNAGYSPAALPAVTDTAPAPGGEAEHLVLGRDISADWWTLFRSPALDTLVKRALAHNPSIEAAQATLRGAQFDVYAQLGYFAPTVSAGYTLERQQLAGNEGGNSPGVQGNGRIIATPQTPGQPPYNEPVTYNLHTAQLTVGYTPDVFGSNIRQVEGLRATQRYQRFQLEAAYITLASNVVAAALQEAQLRAQIAAANEIIAENEAGLRILLEQSRAGAGESAAAGQATGTDARPDTRAVRQSAEPGCAGNVSPRLNASAAGVARQPAIAADRAAAGHTLGRRAVA